MLRTYPSVLNLKLKLKFNTENKVETLSNRSWIAQCTPVCRCLLICHFSSSTFKLRPRQILNISFPVHSNISTRVGVWEPDYLLRTTFGVYHSCTREGARTVRSTPSDTKENNKDANRSSLAMATVCGCTCTVARAYALRPNFV